MDSRCARTLRPLYCEDTATYTLTITCTVSHEVPTCNQVIVYY